MVSHKSMTSVHGRAVLLRAKRNREDNAATNFTIFNLKKTVIYNNTEKYKCNVSLTIIHDSNLINVPK
jgi:hypothetical protein